MDFSNLKTSESTKKIKPVLKHSTNPILNNYDLQDTPSIKLSSLNLKEDYIDSKSHPFPNTLSPTNGFESSSKSTNNIKIESARLISDELNLLGDRKTCILINNMTFKSEKEFLTSNECKLCSMEFSVKLTMKNCKICGNSVCKICSSRRINENRVCDFCFLKAKSPNCVIRRKELLMVSIKKKEDLENNIDHSKDQIIVFGQDFKYLKQKVQAEELEFNATIEESKEKLNKLYQLKSDWNDKLKNTMNEYNKINDKKIQIMKEKEEKINQLNCVKNTIAAKKQLFLAKFNEFTKLQVFKEETENDESYQMVLKENLFIASIKEKSVLYKQEDEVKENKPETPKIEKDNVSSSYNARKPSILDSPDKDTATPTGIKRSRQFSDTKKNNDCYCNIKFFNYHKKETN